MRTKFNILNKEDSNLLLNEINTTPLVDVMLVLLIIFLITIPVVTSSIKVSPPDEKNKIHDQRKNTVIITIDKKGNFYLFDKFISKNNELKKELNSLSLLYPDTSIHILGDKDVAFKDIGFLLALIKDSGLKNVTFLTKP